MFEAKTYIQRRKQLKNQVGSGMILFLGNEESPMNYPANTYAFRQDSSFLYFFGLDLPGLAAVIDIDEKKEMVFGDDIDIEDIIWMGYKPSVKQLAARVGVRKTAPLAALEETVKKAVQKKRKIHFLPPYRSEALLKMARLLGITVKSVKGKASVKLIKAVVKQRSIKTAEEIRQVELALRTTYEMYITAMKMAHPGVYESEICGKIEGIAGASGSQTAFPTILTIDGQTLHNHYHGNKLKKGKLLVVDSGAESPMHYASDITRTIPVGGKFSERQKEIYEVVLSGQMSAIKSMKPGIRYRDIHLQTARVIASGLKDAGLMRGDTNEAVEAGAHALFFPHGLGHLLGLDVHDMEDLGEDYVGYDEAIQRSAQFGLAYLRYAKELNPGQILTVEPGIYFIPALIDIWKKKKKFARFINFAKVEKYRDFGGIRIEDNVLITESSRRVLGRPIPKSVADVEKTVMSA